MHAGAHAAVRGAELEAAGAEAAVAATMMAHWEQDFVALAGRSVATLQPYVSEVAALWLQPYVLVAATLCVGGCNPLCGRPPLPVERTADGRHRLLAEDLAASKRKLRRAQRAAAREAAEAELQARGALAAEALKDGAGARALEAAAAAARWGERRTASWLDDGGVKPLADVRRRWSGVLQERVKEHDERYFRACTSLLKAPSWWCHSCLPRPPQARGLGPGLLCALGRSPPAAQTLLAAHGAPASSCYSHPFAPCNIQVHAARDLAHRQRRLPRPLPC